MRELFATSPQILASKEKATTTFSSSGGGDGGNSSNSSGSNSRCLRGSSSRGKSHHYHTLHIAVLVDCVIIIYQHYSYMKFALSKLFPPPVALRVFRLAGAGGGYRRLTVALFFFLFLSGLLGISS